MKMLRLRSQKILMIIIFTIILIFAMAACNNDDVEVQVFTPSEAVGNRISTYSVINDISYIGIKKISYYGTIERASNIVLPVTSEFDYEILSTCAEGEYLYLNGRYFGIDESNKVIRQKLIFRVNVVDGTVTNLVSAPLPSSGRNNHSIVVHDGYLYYFMEKENNLNDVCRVNINGGDIEVLTDNTNEIFTGIFFTDDGVYYHKSDMKLYETTGMDFENGRVVRENVYTVTLENGLFYCELYDGGFVCFETKSPETEQNITLDVFLSRYLVKSGKIYYVKHLPKVIGYDSISNIELENSTQGKVFMYDPKTGKSEMIVENPEIDILSILDVNDEVLLVRVNTNDSILDSSRGSGEGTYYYMSLIDGEIFELKDSTRR